MAQTERLYKLKNYLDAGRCLTKQALLAEFGISPATLKRDIAHLRDRMNAPIVFDRERGGWRLDRDAQLPGTQYELPGLWLSAQEIHALLTMQHLLGKGTHQTADLGRRIRVQTVGARKMHLPHFQAVGSALLQRSAPHRRRDAPTDGVS